MSLVLVTGGSGFIGAHCILKLLKAGYNVRTTLRDPQRESEVRQLLMAGGAEIAGGEESRLSFVTAGLEKDSGWHNAVEGCRYVLHVASPVPRGLPHTEDEVIVPAREGTLRVLRAARDAGVQRVVLTSSFAAIGSGHPYQSKPFDEASWTNLENRDVTAYDKSKTIAERAAWEFIEEEGGGLELSAINPVAVLGPVLGPDYSVSILLVQRLVAGEVPGCPKLWLGIVDVRDVAELHLRAMISPAAKGERFLAVAGEFLPMRELARILRANLGPKAKRVPKWELPNWAVRIAALRDPAVKLILPELGKIKQASHAKATKVLGWIPRSNEEAVLATAESLLRLGLLTS